MRTSDCVQSKLNSPLERSTSHRRPLLLNHSVKVSLRIDLIVVRCLRLAGLVDVSLPSLSNRLSRATLIFGRIDSILTACSQMRLPFTLYIPRMSYVIPVPVPRTRMLPSTVRGTPRVLYRHYERVFGVLVPGRSGKTESPQLLGMYFM